MENNYLYILLLVMLFIICILMIIFIIRSFSHRNKENIERLENAINEKQNQNYQMTMNLLNQINDIKDSVNDDFRSFNNDIHTNLNNLNDRTSNKLLQMEERISNNLNNSYKSSNELFSKIQEKMVQIDEAQKGISDLSSDILSLQSILQDKKNRGTFGEIELYSLLENAFGTDSNFWEKQYHLSTGDIADAVIFGSGDLGKICVDSKFPLENYRRIYDENLDKVDRESARKLFKADVLKHINDISSKYIIPGETAVMAYMFIPAEAVFSEIYANYPEIVEKSYKEKVYLVSPTTLMAYITAIKSIYLGQKKNEKAQEIELLLNDLSIEFKRFYERCNKLNKDYLTLANDFESINTTSNKLIKRFDKINSGEINENED